MEQYIGLDVSLKDTAISIRQDGTRVWRGKCASDPALLADIIRRHAPQVKRVVFETGPLSTWFYHALSDEGVPAICIEARHAQKILNETLNKTDANDADGLAQLRGNCRSRVDQLQSSNDFALAPQPRSSGGIQPQPAMLWCGPSLRAFAATSK